MSRAATASTPPSRRESTAVNSCCPRRLSSTPSASSRSGGRRLARASVTRSSTATRYPRSRESGETVAVSAALPATSSGPSGVIYVRTAFRLLTVDPQAAEITARLGLSALTGINTHADGFLGEPCVVVGLRRRNEAAEGVWLAHSAQLSSSGVSCSAHQRGRIVNHGRVAEPEAECPREITLTHRRQPARGIATNIIVTSLQTSPGPVA